ncbi:MAG: hypothetical protein ACD_40C00239G0004 [uncultured bacterium]|nr:MAG: hypothetical protein ACD_40C00239G0004 [uncultured bacterium]KKU26477.1 MAG: hypothetical protein UX37_C0002G0043 [Microgenomates group bacterium GW2011_GWA2_46_16]
MTLIHLIREIPPYPPCAVGDTEYDDATNLPERNYRIAQSLLREHFTEYTLVVAEAALTEVQAESIVIN